MNRISTILRLSRYAAEPHPDLLVDDRSLGEIVSDFLDVDPGLIPCVLPWSEDPEETEISFSRFLLAEGATAFAPVLMCPDDLDFWCTIVIAKVEHGENEICWTGLGLNQAEPDPSEAIGSDVEWSTTFTGWRFPKEEYHKVWERFAALKE